MYLTPFKSVITVLGLIASWTAFADSAVNEHRVPLEVRRTMGATREWDRIMSHPYPSQQSLDVQFHRLEKRVTDSSIKYIAVHDRFGEYRKDVLMTWGRGRLKRLGLPFMLSLIHCTDERLATASLTLLDDYISRQDGFPTELTKVVDAYKSFHDLHPSSGGSFTGILVKDRGAKSVSLLKDIAIKDRLPQREAAIAALLQIGNSAALAALDQVGDSLEHELNATRKRG